MPSPLPDSHLHPVGYSDKYIEVKVWMPRAWAERVREVALSEGYATRTGWIRDLISWYCELPPFERSYGGGRTRRRTPRLARVTFAISGEGLVSASDLETTAGQILESGRYESWSRHGADAIVSTVETWLGELGEDDPLRARLERFIAQYT